VTHGAPPNTRDQLRPRLAGGVHVSERDLLLYEDAALQLLYQRIDGVRFPFEHDPRHTFACFRQIQRAFDITFRDIIGNSLPAARPRGAIWQSILTHDMRRYGRTLYARMGEFATLITGPSGTGK
jgi:hypothetical protein